MGLKAKFNLVILAAFLVGLALAAALSWRIVQDNARREVLQEAAIMMAQASAVRDYTTNEIDPLLTEQLKIRLYLQGGGAEPDQSRRPRDRLGDRDHRRVQPQSLAHRIDHHA